MRWMIQSIQVQFEPFKWNWMNLDYTSWNGFLIHFLVQLLKNWWTWLPAHGVNHLVPEIKYSVTITHLHTHELGHHHQEASNSNYFHPPQKEGPCFIISPGSNRKCKSGSYSALINRQTLTKSSSDSPWWNEKKFWL